MDQILHNFDPPNYSSGKKLSFYLLSTLFHVTSGGLSTSPTFYWPPTSSCPRSYWMNHYDSQGWIWSDPSPLLFKETAQQKQTIVVLKFICRYILHSKYRPRRLLSAQSYELPISCPVDSLHLLHMEWSENWEIPPLCSAGRSQKHSWLIGEKGW